MLNIYTRVHHRKDTDESWSASNPVLLDGEIILVSTEERIRLKVGDGVTNYKDLPFLDIGSSSTSGGSSGSGTSGKLTWGDLKDLTS